jgi:tetratricopeptide (TPR) repeat protein
MKFIMALLMWGAFAAAVTAQDGPKVSLEYQKAYQECAEVFQKGEYDAALVLLDKAEQIQPNVAPGYNLRGAIYTKQLKYSEAEKAFQKAIELDPKLFLPLFNLAEVSFLQKNYEESHKRFLAFVEKNGHNDLADFKLYLCDLLGGKADRAKKTLDEQSPSPLTPLVFYMKAAWQFQKGNEPAALEEVQSAVNVYSVGQNNAFAETFIDLGWLKRKENQGTMSALPDSVLTPTPQSSGPEAPKMQTTPGLDLLMPSLDKEKKK